MSVTLPSNLQMFLGLYAYLLPLLLYVLWSTLALWDLGQRNELTTTAVWIWALLIFALPFVGALGYLFLGGARLAPRRHATSSGRRTTSPGRVHRASGGP